MYVAVAISSRASVSAEPKAVPPASSCLVGFGMSVQREFRLLGSMTTCAEYRCSPCLPILHKQHDAPRGVNIQWKIKTFPDKMSRPPLYQVEVQRIYNYDFCVNTVLV